MPNLPEIVRHRHLPTALVAGGAGFLGASLCEYLLTQNFRVVAVDNLKTGNRENLKNILGHPRFLLFEYDLNQGWPEQIKSVDFVFHLAAHEIYTFSKDSKVTLDALLTNALSTHHLLEFTRLANARFLFASTLDVHQGVASATDLWHYFGPSERDEKIFSHAEAKRFAESLVWEYFKKYGLDVRLVRLGEIFGPGMNLESSGNLGRLLQEILAGKDLNIEGDGLEKNYYCYLSDAIQGLYLAMFKDNTKGKIYPLADPNPLTTLEQAYLLKKMANRPTEVVFKPAPYQFRLPMIPPFESQSQKELGWAPQVTFKQGLTAALHFFKYSPLNETSQIPTALPAQLPAAVGKIKRPPAKGLSPSISLPHLSLPKKPALSFSRRLLGIFLLTTVLLFFLRPFMELAFYGWRTGAALNDLRQKAARLDLVNSRSAAASASQNLEHLKNVLSSEWPIPYREGLMSLTTAALYTTKGITALLPALEPFRETLNRLGFTPFKDASSATLPTPQETETSLGEATEKFSYALAEIKNAKRNPFPPFLKSRADQLEQTLLSLTQATALLRVLNGDLTELGGYSERKTYLVLLQNSNELRPNGGFIGSYARFSLEKGYLRDLKVDDIYNPDGLLDEKKVVWAPPLPLKENLGVENLRLRDANWFASFPESGKVITDLYQKATGERVNGVMAFTLPFIAHLLKVVGSINLPTYNETITAENLFERAQFHAEAGFFPGAIGKKTFLSLLGEQLLNNLLTLKAENFPSLLATTDEALRQKDLLVYLPNSRLSAYLQQQGWDGSVKEDTKGDFLMLVEANVGSTKANYFVRRQIKYAIEKVSREGEMEVALSLNYWHTGKDNNWPGGPYKSYLRVLTPLRSALLKVVQSAGGLEERGEDITEKVKIGQEAGKTTFELLFNLKAGENLTLNFSYVLPPEVLNLPAAKNYHLFLQKQPGTGADPLTVEFSPPFGKTFTQNLALSGWSRQGANALWQGVFDRDWDLSVPFE